MKRNEAADAPPEDVETAARGRWRRVVVRGLVALVAALLGALLAVTFHDAPAPDLADLAFEPVAVADEDNAYLALVAFGAELTARPVVAKTEIDDASQAPAPDGPSLRERLLAGEAWNPEQLEKGAQPLADITSRAQQIADLPKGQGRIQQGERTVGASAGDVVEVIEHLRLAAAAAWAEGRRDRAAETLVTASRLAVGVRDSRGTLIDYLTGVAAVGASEAAMAELAGRADVEPAQLRAWLARLVSLPPRQDGYAHSLRNEAAHTLGLLAAHQSKDALEWGMGEKWVRWTIRTRVFFPLVYKRNLSRGLYADHIRAQIGELEGDLARLRARPRGLEACPHCDGLLREGLLRPYNIHGQELISVLTPTLSSLAKTRVRSFARTSLVTTYLALRLHYIERGLLPERLEELVPAYLPAVPIDYVDGLPIRYSRQLGVVWSAGEKALAITAADQEIAKSEMVYWLTFARQK